MFIKNIFCFKSNLNFIVNSYCSMFIYPNLSPYVFWNMCNEGFESLNINKIFYEAIEIYSLNQEIQIGKNTRLLTSSK